MSDILAVAMAEEAKRNGAAQAAGLTKREIMAMHITAAIIGAGTPTEPAARQGVIAADELLIKLGAAR